MPITKYAGGALAAAGGGLVLAAFVLNPISELYLSAGTWSAIFSLIFGGLAVLGGALVMAGKWLTSIIPLIVGIVMLAFGIIDITGGNSTIFLVHGTIWWELQVDIASPLWYFPLETFMVLGGGILGLFAEH